MYRLQDPEERYALSSIPPTITTIANKLDEVGRQGTDTLRALLSGVTWGDPDDKGSGEHNYEAIMDLLDKIYGEILEDSGLRDLLAGELHFKGCHYVSNVIPWK